MTVVIANLEGSLTCCDGYEVSQSGDACIPICGDARVYFGEDCDDGNKNNKDGCDDTCNVEPSYICINGS